MWIIYRRLPSGRELELCGEIFYSLEEAESRVEDLEDENFGEYFYIRQILE